MTRRHRTAAGLGALWLLTVVACLAQTKPLQMTAFFFLGLPALAVSIVLYVSAAFRMTRRDEDETGPESES